MNAVCLYFNSINSINAIPLGTYICVCVCVFFSYSSGDKVSCIRMMIWLCVYHEFYCKKVQCVHGIELFQYEYKVSFACVFIGAKGITCTV